MTNIAESITNIMKTVLDEEPKSPLHVGEVMNFWTYLTMLEEANRFDEMGLNTTTDDELVKAIQHSWNNCNKQVVEIRKFLQSEGISLPPSNEPKPKSNPGDIPLGAKLTDDELANGVVMKAVSAIAFCGVALSQSLRTDVGAMWYNYLGVRMKFNAYYLPIIRKRG